MIARIIEGLKLRRYLTPTQYKAVHALREGDVAIDCGANVGLIARAMAGSGATVHAFEPNPHAHAELLRRSRRYKTLLPRNAAVAVQNGTLRLYLHRDAAADPLKYSQGSSLMVEKGNVNPNTWVDVQAVDLAAFIKDLGKRIAVLKMDIEGAEVDVIPHLIETGAIDNVDLCFVETHERKVPALIARTAAMRDLIHARGLGDKFVLDWH